MSFEVRQGDCVSLMAAMPACSVDSVVCDPPYGLEFMGKEWDRLGRGYEQIGDINFPTWRNESAADREWQAREELTDKELPPTSRGSISARRRNAPDYGLRTAQSSRLMQEWHQAWATEALRVLKPGGHLLAFGGTRTYHRLACAVEDAGFEIRDTICWLYGSGFPKSLDVGKAIDRAAGAEREVVGMGAAQCEYIARGEVCPGHGDENGRYSETVHAPATAPATPEAERWEGWGTALKPAHEPVVVARKPLSGTVAATVLEHGTGALNVDGCRVDTDELQAKYDADSFGGVKSGDGSWNREDGGIFDPGRRGGYLNGPPSGRWPANVVLDEEAARLLDEQTGEIGPSQRTARRVYDAGMYGPERQEGDAMGYEDIGGASRFFYVAKASRGERNAGLEGFARQGVHRYGAGIGEGLDPNAPSIDRNVHPTVKPISLMRWLVRLVTPPDGLVLDPFTGSGSTGAACMLENFDFIGLEREPEYVEIARARIAWWHKHRGDGEAAEILAAGEARDEVEATGQASLFD